MKQPTWTRWRLPFLPALGILFCTLFAAMASGQESASRLSGTVTDTTGAVVPGVEIAIINVETGWQRVIQTNDSGSFLFPLLPAGRYTLSADKTGFAHVTVENLLMVFNLDLIVNLSLRPGTRSESVLVEASPDLIELQGPARVFSVTSEQVFGLPVFTSPTGRNALSIFPFLIPGVLPADTLGGVVPSGTTARGEGVSINGGRPTSISYNLEGGDSNDGELNIASSVLPNPDALREFTVATNNYQADLGRSSGGIVNAVVRRGSDEFHGQVRFFFLNERLNARSFFETRKPENRLQTWGGQLGGPLRRGRTHFFADYEGNRSNLTSQTRVTVPALAWRGGDFSDLPADRQPRDPLTGLPFPDGMIPPARLDTVAVQLSTLLPAPNIGNNEFNSPIRKDLGLDQVTARVDHEFSSQDSLRVTYFLNQTDSTDSNLGAPTDSTLANSAETHHWVAREVHTFSPTLVNQITGTISLRSDDSVVRFGAVDGQAPADFGFQIRPQTNNFLGPPSVGFTSFSLPIGSFDSSSTRDQTTWQIKDDVTLIRGKHSLKFGGEVRTFRLTSVVGNDNGTFAYLGVTNCCGTGNDFADFLLGLAPDSYSQTTGNTLRPRQAAVAFYGMDEWRPRNNLAVNLGVRYELTPPFRDRDNQIVVFRPEAQSQVFPQAPPGLLFFGDADPILGDVPRGAYPTDRNNVSPRLGVVYSPGVKEGSWSPLVGQDDTTIRAGIGVFFDQTYGQAFTEFQFAQPFSVLEFIPSTDSSSAGGTLANPFGTLPNRWPIDLTQGLFLGSPRVASFSPAFRTARTLQYNVTLQRSLGEAMLFELGYVGSKSTQLARQREQNPGVVVPGATPTNIEQRRLFPALSSVLIVESTGEARYDSLQMRLVRRPSQGLSWDISYVWGKSLDDGSAALHRTQRAQLIPGGSEAFPLLWARSQFDRRHSFVARYIYDLPTTGYGGILGFFLNNWQVGGITQLRSGLPLDITQTIESTLTGEADQGRPDLVGGLEVLDPRTRATFSGIEGNYYFTPGAFRAVPFTDFTGARRGTLGRNVFSGPGQNSTSLSALKRISFSERQHVELRADFNNIFNHTNFDQPETLIDRVTFGQVTSAAPGRRVQLSVRYSF